MVGCDDPRRLAPGRILARRRVVTHNPGDNVTEENYYYGSMSSSQCPVCSTQMVSALNDMLTDDELRDGAFVNCPSCGLLVQVKEVEQEFYVRLEPAQVSDVLELDREQATLLHNLLAEAEESYSKDGRTKELEISGSLRRQVGAFIGLKQG